MTDQEDKPEIIVDDDWKARAQAEKEQLQKAAEAKVTAGAETAGSDDSSTETAATETAATETAATETAATETAATEAGPPDVSEAESQPAEMPLPPASFSVLVTSLATQALAMLGQIPLPDGKPMLRLDHAKHYIDTLAMLEERTKGNLEAGEMVMLNHVLHDLRMAYVKASKPSSTEPAAE